MYTKTAEKYSSVINKDLFNKVYSDIADATPTEGIFTAGSLINKLPSLKHYKPKTQQQYIAVVLRDMCKLTDPNDGLIRTGHFYQWNFAITPRR